MPSHTSRRGLGSVIAVAAFALAFGATAAEGNLVGETIPPYPAGLDELQGICIAGGPSLDRICDYGLQVIGRPSADPDRAARRSNCWRRATSNPRPRKRGGG